MQIRDMQKIKLTANKESGIIDISGKSIFIMKIYIIYSILIVFIFSFSCKKDEPSSIKDDCIEIPDSQSPFGYDYEYDTNYIIGPCFNPNNENEILFIHRNYSNNSLYFRTCGFWF
jgi:hypothetical protein